jgi:hypothetical protein
MYGVDLLCYEGAVELDEGGRPVLSKEMADLLANDRDTFYRIAGGPYCVEDDDVPMMQEAISTQVGFESSSEWEAWLESLASATTWEELDAFQIPGGDYDPDDEPECTTRMSGPAASLLAANSQQPTSFCELVAAAEIALGEFHSQSVEANLSDQEEEDTNASDSASMA